MMESRAEPIDSVDKTVFFEDGLFEDKPCRLPVAPYLLFLHLSHEGAAEAVLKLRDALARHPAPLVERDIRYVLSQPHWRLHLMACMAMAAGFRTEGSSLALWESIRTGSWASAQLAATAAYLDKAFVDKAKAVVVDARSPAKSVVGLAALLQDAFSIDIGSDYRLAQAVQEAKLRDDADSGRYSLRWLTGLRRILGAPA
jgi:hypothetical protein